MARASSVMVGPPPGSRTKADEMIVRLLEELQQLNADAWLVIARRRDAEQAALAANRNGVAKLRHSTIVARAAGAAQQKELIAFNRWAHARLLGVVGPLPETAPGADGRPFALRAAATSAARAAEAVLRIFDADVLPARASTLAGPALRPFEGFVTLPPLPAASPATARARAQRRSSEPPAAYHLRFPDDYFVFDEPPPAGGSVPVDWNRRDTHHESWRWPGLPKLACRFGGECHESCAVCAGKLHRLVSLPALPGAGFKGIGPLEIVSCLSCLGWSEPVLFFSHNAKGRTSPIGYEGPLRKPEFPASPLREALVELAATPARWTQQRWEEADGQNLNRIGGRASWVQGPDVPRCCGCRKRMRFLLQLDSELPLVDGQRWRWGSGGVLYVFWCELCRIDAQLWQCS